MANLTNDVTRPESFDCRVLVAQCSVDAEAQSGGLLGTIAGGAIYEWHLGVTGGGNSYADKGDLLERRFTRFTALGDITTGLTWTTGANTLVSSTAAFANYRWSKFDRFYVAAGTGATPGSYLIASKDSDSQITLATSPGANAADNSYQGVVIFSKRDTAELVAWPTFCDGGYLEWIITGTISGGAGPTIAGGTWNEATRKLTKAGAFTSYPWQAGDQIAITGGTNAIPGLYYIDRKDGVAPNDSIILTTSIGSQADFGVTALNDIAGNVADMQCIQLKLYAENEEGLTWTDMLSNPIFLPIAGSSGANGQFELRLKLALNGPGLQETIITAPSYTISGYFMSQPLVAVPNSQLCRFYPFMQRSTADARGSRLFHPTFTKGNFTAGAFTATTSTLDMIPRSYTLLHYAPRIC